MTADELSDRLLDFSLRVGRAVDALPGNRLGRHVAGQLIRCGTAAAPNYEEGRAAESRKDFIHKLTIALKESREARYWIRFIVKMELLPKHRMESLLDEADQLCRILASSVATATGKRHQNQQRPTQ